jgi:uncharacterized membrane protein YbaN (DUF454 family)
MKKIILLTLGHFFLVLGIIGALLPVLPTTPFLLLAAYFYSKSSERIHNWLMNHKYLGPSLRDWHERGVIGIKAKWIATIMLGLIIGWRIPLLDIPLAAKIFASTVLVGVLVFIWSRPSNTSSKKDLT